MQAIKNGTYKKDYEKRKQDPKYAIKKKIFDKIYRDKVRQGVDTSRIINDASQVNSDWQAYAKAWREKTQYGKIKAINRSSSYHNNKKLIINHYTKGKNSCESCGVADVRILQIDHINNDGAEHRKSIGRLTPVWWIIKNNYPEGFQILCANCNVLKEHDRRVQEFIDRNSA